MSPDEARKLLILFAPDFTEVSTITRARALRDCGLEPVVFSFRRGRYNKAFRSPWREVDLGRTADGRYLNRMLRLIGALPVIWRHRDLLRRAAVLYGRNIDQLLLMVLARLFMGVRGRIVYEVLDIAAVFTMGGPVMRFMRWAERRLLERTDILVVSSAAFHREYFHPIQGYRGPVFVIENRLHGDDAAVAKRPVPRAGDSRLPRQGYKWTVGYFGLIRGRPTFDLMVRVAERCPDVLFYFRGILTTVDRRYFAAAIERHPNMIYGGDYVNPGDLGGLYGSVDFTWALDLERENSNSRWLMPCRYFESSLEGVPCLAMRGSELGRRIDLLGTGWTLAPPYEDSLMRLFGGLTREAYERVAARLRAIPAESFITDETMAELCRAMTAPDVGR